MKNVANTVRELEKPRRSYRVEAVARACDILASFTSPAESLNLTTIAERTKINKVTVFRILDTLLEKRLVERVGRRNYRSRLQPVQAIRHRIGFASQSSVVPFQGAVTDNMIHSARAANIDLYLLNNQYSPTQALRNADRFVEERVELVIESQISVKVASQITSKLTAAHIPCIAIDIPHPNAFYFGADNYKAGRVAGEYLAQWAMKSWKGVADQIVLAGAAVSGPALDARLTGIHDGILKLLPSCRHVSVFRYDTKGHFDNALNIMRRHIRLNPAARVIVGAVNDVSALGALQAFRDFGKEQNCIISGQGACLEARQELRRRKTRFICSVAYFPEYYGDRVIRLALDILEGRQVPPAIFTQHELVTSNSVDKLYPNDTLLSFAGQTY